MPVYYSGEISAFLATHGTLPPRSHGLKMTKIPFLIPLLTFPQNRHFRPPNPHLVLVLTSLISVKNTSPAIAHWGVDWGGGKTQTPPQVHFVAPARLAQRQQAEQMEQMSKSLPGPFVPFAPFAAEQQMEQIE